MRMLRVINTELNHPAPARAWALLEARRWEAACKQLLAAGGHGDGPGRLRHLRREERLLRRAQAKLAAIDAAATTPEEAAHAVWVQAEYYERHTQEWMARRGNTQPPRCPRQRRSWEKALCQMRVNGFIVSALCAA